MEPPLPTILELPDAMDHLEDPRHLSFWTIAPQGIKNREVLVKYSHGVSDSPELGTRQFMMPVSDLKSLDLLTDHGCHRYSSFAPTPSSSTSQPSSPTNVTLATIRSDQRRAQAQFDLFQAMVESHMNSVQTMMASMVPAVPLGVSPPTSSSSSSSSVQVVQGGSSNSNTPSYTTQQVVDLMNTRTASAPSVVVQAAQSDSKRMDHLGLELIKGVYSPVYFQSNFPPVDLDATTGRVSHYNIAFAVDTLRFQKNQSSQLDPELSDAMLKALLMLRWNSGPTGISLHAILGKTVELSVWSDVLKALRIFRQICETFIHPDLALHVAQLLTRVEDLRLQYQLISTGHWVRIFHTIFSKLRNVTAMLEADPGLDYSKMLKDLFHFDISNSLFQVAMLSTTLSPSSRQAQKTSSP
jgi:hypothetical protein